MRTLGQKRAEYALEKVLEMPEDKKKDFKSFSAGAPSIILQNGFGQALAFWLAKGTYKHIAIFNIIKEWLSYKKKDIKNSFVKKTENPADFIKELSDMDQIKYLTAQKETLALLEWVKRYSNAEL